jgi:hypothetical protein
LQGEGEDLRAGAVTYLCVLANEDIGAKVGRAVADHGGERLEWEDDSHLACFERAGSGSLRAARARTVGRRALAR